MTQLITHYNIAEPDYFTSKGSGYYYGAYTLANTSLNFSQRASIVATGVNIANAQIPYPPLNPAPVCIDYAGTPPVSIANIPNIRCDGVVEYSYNYNGFVYGATRIMLTVNGA